MSMRLFVGGARGSQPCTGGFFDEFGGDTTSLLLVCSSGERLVLDAGTGMRAVAEQLAEGQADEVTILFSHYHLDHMVGLTMNPLFFDRDWTFTLVGPSFEDGGVRDAVSLLLGPPYWPISYDHMSAEMRFGQFTTNGIEVGHLRVRGCRMPHPGGCMAYRIEGRDCRASLVFATDIEWGRRTAEDERAFVALCRQPKSADVLVMDAHFSRATEKAFLGWGHTSWEDCLEIAKAAGVERVLLGHHDPRADDKSLYALEQQIKAYMSNAALLRAGQWLTIGE